MQAQKKGTLAVLTGGGDCPGLNAVIRAVVKTAIHHGFEIYGISNGFHGLINGDMKLMDLSDVSGILPREGPSWAPPTGTTHSSTWWARMTLSNPIYEDKRDVVVKNLKDRKIDCLIVIGGDGSLKIAYDLHRYCDVNVVGVPKTIDNDLPCTERTFGFDTAMSMGTEALDRLHTTAGIPSPGDGAGSDGPVCGLDRSSLRNCRRGRRDLDPRDPL